MAHRFNPAPGWPQPPQGWTPPAGWRPDPSWPPAPEGWQFWVDDDAAGSAAGVPTSAPDAGSAERPGPATTAGQPSAPAPQHLGPSAAAAAAPGPAAGDLHGAEPSAQSAPVDQPLGQEPFTQQSPQAFGGQPTEHVPQQQAPSFGQDQATEHLQQPGAPFDQPTQQFGAPQPYSGAPTQQFGGPDQTQQFGQPSEGGYGGAGAGFDYAGAQPEQGTSPYAGQQAQPYQQYPGQQYPGQQYPGYADPAGGPGGPGGSGKKRTGLIVTIIVIIALVLAGIVWGIIALLSGDDSGGEPTAGPTQTQEAPTPDPTQTTPPTTQPSPDPSTAPDPEPEEGGNVVELAPGEFATVTSLGTEIGELTITDIETGWSPDPNNIMCSAPEDGTEYALLHVEVNTNSNVEPSGHIFTGIEFSTVDADGNEAGSNLVFQGMLCLDDSEILPSEWQADESYSGLVLASFTPETTFVQFHDFLDFSGEAPSYRWRIADFS